MDRIRIEIRFKEVIGMVSELVKIKKDIDGDEVVRNLKNLDKDFISILGFIEITPLDKNFSEEQIKDIAEIFVKACKFNEKRERFYGIKKIEGVRSIDVKEIENAVKNGRVVKVLWNTDYNPGGIFEFSAERFVLFNSM
ncbi:MAG: hypothetical protein DRN95_06920 [Candidatus Hydrothermarchaeota archaeon]|nr:MAG: hypothetical protein DRN95_06920 [Candidatus Hydrothermarchaeota archaeon]